MNPTTTRLFRGVIRPRIILSKASFISSCCRPSFRYHQTTTASISSLSFRHFSAIRTTTSTTYHPSFFVHQTQQKQQQQQRWIGRKARSRKRREKDRARSRYENWLRDQRKKQRLHPAAQWKRILSAIDYWFSKTNLPSDEFLKEELRNNDGWCTIDTILTFRKFQHWTTASMIVDALTSSEGKKRYSVDEDLQRFRHKKVTLEKLAIWEYADDQGGIEEDYENDLAHFGHDFGPLSDEFVNDFGTSLYEVFDEDEEESVYDDLSSSIEEEEEKKTPSIKRLPRYKTKREIMVVDSKASMSKAMSALQDSITAFVEKHGDDIGRVVGFDVEYASLEYDIRGNLPALLQLASPSPTGPVLLMWLDKLPEHGKTLFTAPAYALLAELLRDSSIGKVGVGASKDAKNLASWCGITGGASSYLDYFIAGIVDLEDETIDGLDRNTEATYNLKDLTSHVLQRFLVKRKTNLKDEKRSHWRAKRLTKRMKEYAAEDASAACDIWLALRGIPDTTTT